MREAILAALDRSLTEQNIAGELSYYTDGDRASFERPYGVAWFLQLVAELDESDDPQMKRWRENLRPLENSIVANMMNWLPNLAYPIRVGTHNQSAFAFGLMLDYARQVGSTELEPLLVAKSLEFHEGDRDCPIGYEPSGEDFLSPCLMEADLMRRVMPSDRFAEWPVKVDVLSRFNSAKETQQALDRMLDGKTDIVVGTHKLLQKDVKFDHLGLLIIDEEHRFGVQQKERLKALRAEVDMLNLTATPIPRTLNMAMGHLRDLSIIATPPARRLSVRTFVRQKDNAMVKEAILREILRGGQVYFLHNDVATIEKTAEDLRSLIPEARVGVVLVFVPPSTRP